MSAKRILMLVGDYEVMVPFQPRIRRGCGSFWKCSAPKCCLSRHPEDVESLAAEKQETLDRISQGVIKLARCGLI